MFSYIVGVILSSFSSAVVKRLEKSMKHQNMYSTIPADLFPGEVIKAFREAMAIPEDKEINWTPRHYHLCLTLVSEKMPLIAQRIERQRNIALLRRNLISPLFVWGIAGISWGIDAMLQGAIGWGITLVILSLVLSWISIIETIKRMHHGAGVEIRETLLGFLAGHKLGLVSKAK